VPDGRARVRRSPPSPRQSAAGLGLTARSSASASLRHPDRCSSFCRAPSIWIGGTARSRRRPSASHAPPAHPDSKSLPTDVPRTPSSVRGVRRTSGSEDSEGSWRPPVVIILLLGGPTCALRLARHIAWEDRPIPEVGLRFLDDYFCLTSCFAARAAASM
jgi:hypothetical protein